MKCGPKPKRPSDDVIRRWIRLGISHRKLAREYSVHVDTISHWKSEIYKIDRETRAKEGALTARERVKRRLAAEGR